MNKSVIAIVLLLQLTFGCVQMPKETVPRLYAVEFPSDLLDRNKGETVHQLIITASPASIYRIDKLPFDWSVAASSPSSSEVTCELRAGHDSSATWDIHDLNDVVYLRVNSENDLEITAELFVTEGRVGPGRTLSVDRGQISLKLMGTAPDWQ
jgi:hypothetical protein